MSSTGKSAGQTLDDQAEDLSAQLNDRNRQPDARIRETLEGFREHVGV